MPDASELKLTFKSDLPEDTFHPVRFHFEDQLNRPYRLLVDLLATEDTLDVDKLLGKQVQLDLPCPNGARKRHLSGYVTKISYLGRPKNVDADQRFNAAWRLEARPWIALLDHGRDCKVHKGTAPEIVQQVFRDAGFTAFDDKLGETYRTREFCVQYRESKMQFVHRLLEEEGIRYWHKLEDGDHTLILCDNKDGHAPVDDYTAVSFNPPEFDQDTMVDSVRELEVSHNFGATKVTLEEYDFEAPSSEMTTEGSISRNHGTKELEFYDYPGSYGPKGDGTTLAQVRAEELQAHYEVVHGQGVARGINAGSPLTLEDHPRDDQNRDYLVIAYELSGRGPGLSSGRGGDMTFESRFQAVPLETPWRPKRATPIPVVDGPHTAEVVGSGDIWTDKYGRVKVQFHWDRDGKRDEESSCWCRVSQFWAGNGWGSMHIPHVGHEVIVEFLEGNPDRPIITGRLYNGSNATFEPLTDNQEKSGFRDVAKNELIMTSTEGGEKIEIRDTFGSELVLDSAEKTAMLRSPNHESKIILGKSVNLASDSDWKILFGGDQDEEIQGNRKSKVKGDTEMNYSGYFKKMVIGDANVKVGGDLLQFSLAATTKVEIGATESLVVAQNAKVEKAISHSAVFGKAVTLHKAKAVEAFTARHQTTQALEATYLELKEQVKDHTLDQDVVNAKINKFNEEIAEKKEDIKKRRAEIKEDLFISDGLDQKVKKLKCKAKLWALDHEEAKLGDAMKIV